MRFMDPIAQVVFKDYESGTEWHLGSPSYPFLTSLSISYHGNMVINSLNVGVDIPYEYAIPLLDTKNKSPFRHKNLVKARIGYSTGGWTGWAHGALTEGAKGLSMTAEGLAGTITVPVVPIKAAGYTVSRELFSQSGYDAEKFIRSVAREIGFELDVTDKASSNMNAWKLAKQDKISYKEKNDFYGGMAGKSAWDAISIVCKEIDCEFFTENRKNKKYLIVYTSGDATHGNIHSDPSEINRYVIRGILDPSINQYPCYAFTPEDDSTTWIAGSSSAASGVNAVGIDKKTGEDVRQDVRPEDQEDAQVGKISQTTPQDMKTADSGLEETVIDVFKQDGKLGTYMSGPIIPGGAGIFKNQARSFQKQGDPGLRMDISTIGIPDESVLSLCELQGAGRLFNGTYCIEKLTHSWSPGTWDMILTVFHKGTISPAGEQKEAAGGQMPTSQ